MPDPVAPVVEIEREPPVVEDPGAVVELAPPVKVSEEEQVAAKVKEDYERLYGGRLKQLENTLHGSYRINKDLQKKVEDLTQQVQQVLQPKAPAPVKDRYETLVEQGHWQQAVNELAEERANHVIAQREAVDREQTRQATITQTLEACKRQVVTKYADLDPESGNEESAVSKVYSKVLSDHPDYLSNPYGPLLAMYKMEEELIAHPIAVTVESRKGRVAAGSPPARPMAPSNKVVLSREQKAFCDHQGLDYTEYARTLQALEAQPEGGVSA